MRKKTALVACVGLLEGSPFPVGQNALCPGAHPQPVPDRGDLSHELKASSLDWLLLLYLSDTEMAERHCWNPLQHQSL